MRNKLKIALLTLLLFLSGCGMFQTRETSKHLEKDVASATKVVNTSAGEILESSAIIDDNVVSITHHAKKIQGNTKATTQISSDANSIGVESSKLKTVSSNLSKAGVKLEISGRTIDDYVERTIEAEKENSSLTDENLKLKEDVKTGMNKMLKWIVGGCLVGAGACAAMAMFFGNIRGGVIGAASCLTIMTLAIAVGQYMAYIAIAGVLVIVASLGLVGYQMFIQRKAISDNVWTQEVVKRNLSTELREKLYGPPGESGQAGKIQSKSTQKIVKRIKRRLPKGWTVVKDDSDLSD
jgi:hypothetical protein